MGIEFHCSKCSRLIRAPDDSGGKRGKCPYCKESVYIPTPREDLEDIPVAPLDEDSVAVDRRLREESIRYSAALDHEEGEAYETSEPPAAEGGVPMARIASVDVGDMVRDFLTAMKDSDMASADAAVEQLKSRAAQAKEHVQRLLVDELMPADLSDIPPPVYKGFLRSLLNRI